MDTATSTTAAAAALADSLGVEVIVLMRRA
jgi:predicted RecB family endonuclease